MAEELDLHLFEFATPENVVAWIDLVAERLADLRDSEGKLHPVRVHHILILSENGLSGLGPEVSKRSRIVVFCRSSHVGLEHQLEFTRFG